MKIIRTRKTKKHCYALCYFCKSVLKVDIEDVKPLYLFGFGFYCPVCGKLNYLSDRQATKLGAFKKFSDTQNNNKEVKI